MTFKYTADNPVSLESLALMAGGDWARREHSRTTTPPTQDDLDDYTRACDLLDQLRLYDGFDEGYEGCTITEPQPKVHIEWAETDAEWRNRITEKARREGPPRPAPVFDPAPISAALLSALDTEETA